MRKPLTTPDDAPNVAVPPLRYGVRSKRTQSVFEVSRVSKRLRTDSDVMNRQWSDQATCSECNKKSKADSLLQCIGKCSNKIHRSCLPPQFGKKNSEQSYECNDCQTCSLCKTGFPDATKLLKCYHCFTCYHPNCYIPNSIENIRMLKEKRFSCASCQKNQKATPTKPTAAKVARSRASKSLPTVTEASDLETSDVGQFMGFSPSDLPPLQTLLMARSNSVDRSVSIRNAPEATNSVRNVINNNHNNIDDTRDLPNAIKWTIHEVYEYFKKIFPRQAHVFEDEEIDGATLYHLKREDVVGRFKLKVGPSIKVYEHILKMQKQQEENSS